MIAWPQWTYILFFMFSMTLETYRAAKNGAPINVPISLTIRSIIVAVLYFGGFWAPLGFAP